MKSMKILDVFVVMPNHVHGIIIINKTNGSADTTSAAGNTDVETQNTDVETQYTDVETQNFASLLHITKFCVSTAHYKTGTLFVKSELQYTL
jgi:REP element-mobilizing transposase RayT